MVDRIEAVGLRGGLYEARRHVHQCTTRQAGREYLVEGGGR